MPVCEVVLVFVVHYQAPLILTQNHVGWCRGYRELAIAFLSEEPHVRWATPACALMYVPYAAVAQPPGVPLWTSSHAIWKNHRGGGAWRRRRPCAPESGWGGTAAPPLRWRAPQTWGCRWRTGTPSPAAAGWGGCGSQSGSPGESAPAHGTQNSFSVSVSVDAININANTN